MLDDGSTTPFARVDDDQTGIGPRERLYRCLDEWIALWCPDGAAWSALGEDLEARLSRMSVANAVMIATGAGAYAVRVREDQHHAFLDDAANQAGGLVARYRHPRFGLLEQVGSFWTFGGVPTQMGAAPPTLGQHSCELLSELGCAPSEIETMIVQGVVVQDRGEHESHRGD